MQLSDLQSKACKERKSAMADEKQEELEYTCNSIQFRKYGELILPASFTESPGMKEALRMAKDLVVISNMFSYTIMLDPAGMRVDLHLCFPSIEFLEKSGL